jgi:hypothetical protein
MIKMYRKDIYTVSLHLIGKLKTTKTYYSVSTLKSILDSFEVNPTNYYHYYIVEVPKNKPYIYVTKHKMWAKYFKAQPIFSEEERIWYLQDIAQKRYKNWLQTQTEEVIADMQRMEDEQDYLERYEVDTADLNGMILTDFNPHRVKVGDEICINQPDEYTLEFTKNSGYLVSIVSKEMRSDGVITLGFAGKINNNRSISGSFNVYKRQVINWHCQVSSQFIP